MSTIMPIEDHVPRAGSAGILLLFGATLFLSALLLFSVQPLFSKMVLPRLGGTPAVWSVAMVFFQAMLLAGYAYAHGIVRFAGLTGGIVIHIAVLAAAVFWLPLQIAPGFDQPPESGVAFWLLALFLVSIGVPFFAISANAPLLQAWFSRTGHRHAHDPYFLYGTSNLGSFFALLSYPVLVEPALGISDQSQLWFAGYIFLGAGVVICGFAARSLSSRRGQAAHQGAAADATPRCAPTAKTRLSWLAFAFIPSGLLVAVTAHISTDVAAAPLLWVMPLALFLLTFVITFQRRPVIPHLWMRAALPMATVAAAVSLMGYLPIGIVAKTAIHLTFFFVAAMVCHGELVARRPDVSHLTAFYLAMSFGGVLGGAFTALLSPVIFSTVQEYPILMGAAILAMPEFRALIRRRPRMVAPALLLAAPAVLFLAIALRSDDSKVIDRQRSFFGVLTIRVSPDGRTRNLVHGTTIHGAQRIADTGPSGGRPEPLTYYTAGGPLASAIIGQRDKLGRPINVGIVGLGVGSLACHAAEGDNWRYYEIDPAVVRVATDPRYFTFLSACTPHAPIIIGDARLTVMREPDGIFDVLLIDAFSSDAIPVHLLTREAIAGYFTKLAAGGIVVMHISNRHMELRSVLAAIAMSENLAGAGLLYRKSPEDAGEPGKDTEAVVLARSPDQIEQLVDAGWQPFNPRSADGVRAWTDDYANIIGAIMRR